MILEAINTILNSSDDLKAYTGDKIYAVLIDQDVSGNIVAFNAESTMDYSKSGLVSDDNTVSIACISPEYNNAARMAHIVRGLMMSASSIPIPNGTRIFGAKVDYISRTFDAIHKEYSINLRVLIKSKTN